MKLAMLLVPLVVLLGLARQTGAPPVPDGDQWLTKPVDDRTFATYLDFFAYDRQVPFDAKVTKVDADQGVRRERLSFQSTPGVRVTAILFQTAAASGSKPPALVLLHGGGAEGKDGAGIIQLALLLARAGWTVLTPDLQYFGERSSSLLTTFSEQEKHEKLYNASPVYLAWATQNVKDIRRAIDFLVEQRGVDPRRIGIFGLSRGAIVASIAGGVERRLSPVVMFYGGHFDALETNHLPAACPANYIGRIAPRPLLLVNGTQDSDMVKARAVDPLLRLAKQPKQIIWTDGGHGFTTEEHRAAVIQWLREQHK
jgi:dienelactone hydrolase